MKTSIKFTIVALSITVAGSAFAQGHNDHDDHGRSNDRGYQQQSHDNGHNDRNDSHRGGGPRHDLYKGKRISKEYRSNQYVVSDWRGHRLSAPPRGYHWVQTGSDYALIAVASGVIAQIFLGN